MKIKYPEEKIIRQKIHELFADRKLSDLLRYASFGRSNAFVKRLHEVQFRIYLLDAYLESRLVLEDEALQQLWTGIEEAVKALGYAPKQIRSRLSEIREYERIEKACRKGIWPTTVPLKKFYTVKSCDVRLVRRLIYAAAPALEDTWHEKAWRYADRITEVYDDIADIAEDIHTYNGNRFLISVLRKGAGSTCKKYEAFLQKETGKARHFFKNHADTGRHRELEEWTIRRSEETLLLLKKTEGSQAYDMFSSSLWLKEMK